MNKTHLIAIDSDGTLRDDNGIISENMKRITAEIIKKNNIVVVCTARPRYHTLKIAKELNGSDYIISSNGAEIFDTKENKSIYSKFIDSKECINIYNIAKRMNVRTIFCLDNIEYASMYTVNESQDILDDNNVEQVANKQIKQIMLYSTDKELILKLKEKIKKDVLVNIADSSHDNNDYYWFSVNSSDTDKGKALKYLARLLNINKSEVIAIGNDDNDISMIKYAGIGVAVSNATTNLKSQANKIIKSNNEDGVYLFLKEWSENI